MLRPWLTASSLSVCLSVQCFETQRKFATHMGSLYVLCFRLGNSRASEFYILTFRNTSFIPIRLWRWNRQCSETSAYKIGVEILHLSTYEYGTECSETSAYKIDVEILHLSAYEDVTDSVPKRRHIKIDVEFLHIPPMKMELCSETSAYKIDVEFLHLSAYEDGTDRVFRNVGI
jgi:hypothetical protein